MTEVGLALSVRRKLLPDERDAGKGRFPLQARVAREVRDIPAAIPHGLPQIGLRDPGLADAGGVGNVGGALERRAGASGDRAQGKQHPHRTKIYHDPVAFPHCAGGQLVVPVVALQDAMP